MAGTRSTLFALACCVMATGGCDEKLTESQLPAAAPSAVARAETSPLRIELTDGDPTAVAISGLSDAQLSTLARLDAVSWPDVFAVFVGADESTERPAVLGTYAVDGRRCVFRPRYPLVRGIEYHVVFLPAAIDGDGSSATAVTRVIYLAKPTSPPTTITDVFPSRDLLPENQLKFYIHFSAPMSRGEAYRHLHLVDESAGEVEYPFLELGEELWDGAGRRFTLFFDPGRIKRGLKPREDVGPSLESGKSYRLVIDADWLDAAGNPLAAPLEKPFRVGPPDESQPDPGAWQLTTPAADTHDPLVVNLGEPLDHAMLQRVLTVTRPDDTLVDGTVSVDQHETVWRFSPAEVWRSGDYQILVDTALEDLAGNSIARPFEVDVVRPVRPRVKTESVSVPFRVTSAQSESR